MQASRKNSLAWPGGLQTYELASRKGSLLQRISICKENTIMLSLTEYLTFQLPARMTLENITSQVEGAVRTSGIQEGLVLVKARHGQDTLAGRRPA